MAPAERGMDLDQCFAVAGPRLDRRGRFSDVGRGNIRPSMLDGHTARMINLMRR